MGKNLVDDYHAIPSSAVPGQYSLLRHSNTRIKPWGGGREMKKSLKNNITRLFQ